MLSSFLNKLWGDLPSSFGYTIGDQLSVDCALFTAYDGRAKSDNSRVTILWYDKKDSERLEDAENYFSLSKSLRHPSILKVLDTADVASGYYIATESAVPLVDYKHLNLSLTRDLSWHAYKLLDGLCFLQQDAHRSHCSISPYTSIFVTEEGSWKLGGWHLCRSLDQRSSILDLKHDIAARPWLAACLDYLPDSAVAPAYIADRLGLAAVLLWAHNMREGHATGLRLPSAKNTSSCSDLFRSFLCEVCKVKEQTWCTLRNHAYFAASRSVSTLKFLDSVSLRGQVERVTFFEQLPSAIEHIDTDVQKYLLLPSLLSFMITVPNQAALAVPLIVRISEQLVEDPQAFQRLVLKPLQPLLISSDRATRFSVLQYVPQFEPHMTSDIARRSVDPLVFGLSDAVPQVREATIRALPCLMPHVTRSQLESALSGLLLVVKKDPVPSLRANGLVAMFQRGPIFPADAVRNFLVQGILHGLKDSCSQNRTAALHASVCGLPYYDVNDVISKLIPGIALRFTDDDADVRELAFDSMTHVTLHARRILMDNQTPEMDTPKDPSWVSWVSSAFSRKTSQPAPPTQPELVQQEQPTEDSSAGVEDVIAPGNEATPLTAAPHVPESLPLPPVQEAPTPLSTNFSTNLSTNSSISPKLALDSMERSPSDVGLPFKLGYGFKTATAPAKSKRVSNEDIFKEFFDL